jgi:hypothetical protein
MIFVTCILKSNIKYIWLQGQRLQPLFYFLILFLLFIIFFLQTIRNILQIVDRDVTEHWDNGRRSEYAYPWEGEASRRSGELEDNKEQNWNEDIYNIVRTVNEHNQYGMVLQMYLTIHKCSIVTNVTYSNNDYMFRPRGPSSGCVIGS